MGDLYVRGDASYKGRAAVDGRLKPEWDAPWDDSKKVDNQPIHPIGHDHDIFISKNDIAWIKEAQANGVSFTVRIDGKEYEIPQLQ